MKHRPCIFGEVLFDHFPDGRRVLGGAPFNVAWHLQAFGAAPYLVSRIGADDEGSAVREAMTDWGMDNEGLSIAPTLPTGQVRVRIERNEPSYEIVQPVAWDDIRLPERIPEFFLLYHGSLALRSIESRTSCLKLREVAESRQAMIFVDVNLRPPWWKDSEVLHSIRGAHWVKLNGQELARLAPQGDDPEQRARRLMESCGLSGLLLTDGSRGASLLTADGKRRTTKPQTGIQVADTVGAGDAMASVMILGLLSGWDLQVGLDRAQAFASAIVGCRGATVHDPAFYEKFTRAWSDERSRT